jgi:hypothetical protein
LEKIKNLFKNLTFFIGTTQNDLVKDHLIKNIEFLGGKIVYELSESTDYVICCTLDKNQKEELSKFQNIKITTGHWIDECSRCLTILPVEKNVLFTPLPKEAVEGMEKYCVYVNGESEEDESDLNYLIEGK